MIPGMLLKERLRWIFSSSILLLTVNQGRMFFELLWALVWPSTLSTVDIFLYPLLPAVALLIWYKGLNRKYEGFKIGRDYALG
jgi:hypothetical protein